MNPNALSDKPWCGAREPKRANEQRPFNGEEELSDIGHSGSKAHDEGQLLFLLTSCFK